MLGDDHPTTLLSMNNLAGVMHDQGDLVGARSVHEAVLAGRRRVLGDHLYTLCSTHNLAVVLRDQGGWCSQHARHHTPPKAYGSLTRMPG